MAVEDARVRPTFSRRTGPRNGHGGVYDIASIVDVLVEAPTAVDAVEHVGDVVGLHARVFDIVQAYSGPKVVHGVAGHHVGMRNVIPS